MPRWDNNIFVITFFQWNSGGEIPRSPPKIQKTNCALNDLATAAEKYERSKGKKILYSLNFYILSFKSQC